MHDADEDALLCGRKGSSARCPALARPYAVPRHCRCSSRRPSAARSRLRVISSRVGKEASTPVRATRRSPPPRAAARRASVQAEPRARGGNQARRRRRRRRRWCRSRSPAAPAHAKRVVGRQEAPPFRAEGQQRPCPRPRAERPRRLEGIRTAAECDGFAAIEDDQIDEAPVVVCRRIDRRRIEGRRRALLLASARHAHGDTCTQVALEQDPVAGAIQRSIASPRSDRNRRRVDEADESCSRHRWSTVDDTAVGRSLARSESRRSRTPSPPDCSEFARRRLGAEAATRRTSCPQRAIDDRLVGALAAEILGGAPSHDRLTRPRKTVDPYDGVDRSVADDVDHPASR